MTNTRRIWSYPVAARYHAAMSSLIATEHNLPYFLGRAAESPCLVTLEMAEHNIALWREQQATAIGWASRD